MPCRKALIDANDPAERLPPFPETIDLLVGLGANNNNNCVSC